MKSFGFWLESEDKPDIESLSIDVLLNFTFGASLPPEREGISTLGLSFQEQSIQKALTSVVHTPFQNM